MAAAETAAAPPPTDKPTRSTSSASTSTTSTAASGSVRSAASVSVPSWTVNRTRAPIPLVEELGRRSDDLDRDDGSQSAAVFEEHHRDNDETAGPSVAATATSGGWTAVVMTTTPISSSASHPELRLSAWYEFPVFVERDGPTGIVAAEATTLADPRDGNIRPAKDSGEENNDEGNAGNGGTSSAQSSPITPVVRVTRTLARPSRVSGSRTMDEVNGATTTLSSRLRLAAEIAAVPGNAGVVRVYAADFVTGEVVTWTLPLVEETVGFGASDGDATLLLHPDALVKLPVNSDAHERITSIDIVSMTAQGYCTGTTELTTSVAPVAVGTSLGHLYWIQRTSNPVTLQAWRVGASSSTDSASTAGSTLAALFQVSSWFSPAPKPKKPRLSPPIMSTPLAPSPPHQKPAPRTGPPRHPTTSHAIGGPPGTADVAVVRAILLVPLGVVVAATASSVGADDPSDRTGLLAVVRRRAVEVWSVHGTASHPTFRCVGRTDLSKKWAQWVQSHPNEKNNWLYDGLLTGSARIVEATSEGPVAIPTGSAKSAPDTFGVHVLVKTDAVESSMDDADLAAESLYWVQLDVTASDGASSIRSAVPLQQVRALHLPPNHSWACRGMQVSEDGTRYVALTTHPRTYQHPSNDLNAMVPVVQHKSVLLAIDTDVDPLSSDRIHEFDLASAGGSTFLTPIRLDAATPGCVLYTTSGDQMLVRFASNFEAPVLVDARLTINAEVDPSAVAKMVQHLRGTVRELLDDPFHFPSGITLASFARLIPAPKVGGIDSSNRLLTRVEAAILQLSRLELRRDNPYDPGDDMEVRMTPASAYGKLERHESLIVLMQRGGMYRALSVPAKVELFASGQQLKVFAAFIAAGSDSSPRSEHLSQFVARLSSPLDLEEWFEAIESAAVKGHGRASGLGMALAELICESITASAAYKASRLQPLYGVCDSHVRQMLPTIPLWPCRPSFQRMLQSHFRRWMNEAAQEPKTKQDWYVWVETIVVAALQSFRDSYEAVDRAQAAEVAYAEIQDIAIPLLGCVLSSDELAWRLSIEHGYFRGLCVIARRHEHRQDRDLYKLDPLFKHFNGKSSAGKPGFPFCHFVLDWHAKECLLGHVLEYGERCPGALSALLKGNREYENLRQFQWIHSIRHGDHEKSAESLLSNAKREGSSLADVKVDLALATLSNRLAAGSSFVTDCRADIESLRNLVVIQEELLGGDSEIGVENQRFLSPEELLEVVFDKVSSQKHSGDNRVEGTARLLLLGLHVCTALHSTTDIQHRACQVWLTAIQQDQDWLTKTLEGSASPLLSLSPEMIELLRERSVFGSLLFQFAYGGGAIALVSYLSVEKQVRSTLPSVTLLKGLATLARVAVTNDAGGNLVQ